LTKSAWHWLEQDAWGGADGASIVDIARGTDIRASDHFAREVIQNSWDAAQELRSRPGHAFRVRFTFLEFEGTEARLLRDKFALQTLGERVSKAGNIVEGSDSISSTRKFRVLLAEDFGGHGLFGHPRLRKKSVLYRALYFIGGSDKFAGSGMSGGSFGFGKSAFINASASNTVFAYSKFEMQPGDPVTRRFVGWSWHESHSLDDVDFEGRAVFAKMLQRGSSGTPEGDPFADDEADSLAANFSVSDRSENSINSLGTSLILMDPVIEPEELIESIEQNWWPAIEDPDIHLDLEVVDYQGEIIVPRPKQQESLKELRRAFELATQPSDAPLVETQRVIKFENIKGFESVGRLGLVAVAPDEGDTSLSLPVIKLTRLPRMIVGDHQHQWNPKKIKIFGVFAVSSGAFEADTALKKTEPHFHDHWSLIRDDKNRIPEEATQLAIQINQKITEAVNTFARELNSEASVAPRRLPGFNKVLGQLFGSSKGAPKPVEGEPLPFSFRFSQPKKEVVDESHILFRRSLTLSMKEDDQFSDKHEVLVRVKADFYEILDQTDKGDRIGLSVKAPKKVRIEAGPDDSHHVQITRGNAVKLEFISDPYSSKISGNLQIVLEEVAE